MTCPSWKSAKCFSNIDAINFNIFPPKSEKSTLLEKILFGIFSSTSAHTIGAKTGFGLWMQASKFITPLNHLIFRKFAQKFRNTNGAKIENSECNSFRWQVLLFVNYALVAKNCRKLETFLSFPPNLTICSKLVLLYFFSHFSISRKLIFEIESDWLLKKGFKNWFFVPSLTKNWRIKGKIDIFEVRANAVSIKTMWPKNGKNWTSKNENNFNLLIASYCLLAQLISYS